MELYQIILLALAVIIAGLYIYQRVTGKDILRHIVLVRPVVNAIASAVAAVYNVFPGHAEAKVVQDIMKAAINGAELAEKAWKMGALEKDERNAYAKTLVANTLAEAGITVTPQIQMIINGAIEATCMVLPHE